MRLAKRLAVVSLLLLACAHARAQPFDPNTVTRRYVVVRDGEVLGEQLVADVDPKTMRVRWSLEIEGRHTKLDAGYALGNDNHPAWIETVGHDAFGRPVDERFVRTRREANWHTRGERGRRRTRRPHFYLSFDRVPEEYALLTRALLAAPKRTLPLLPSGRAKLTQLGELDLASGRGTTRVRGYGILGLEHVPVEVWLGPDASLVALAHADYTVVRDRWQSAAARFEAERRRRALERQQTWAQQLRRSVPTTLAIVNADVFDPTRQIALPAQTVLITGDRVSTVGPTAEIRIPPDSRRLDARRALLLPGLWDLDGRTKPPDGLLHLAAGVTSIGSRDHADPRRTHWLDPATGTLGPRVHHVVAHEFRLNDPCVSPSDPPPTTPWLEASQFRVGFVTAAQDVPVDQRICIGHDLAFVVLHELVSSTAGAAWTALSPTVRLPLAGIEHALLSRPREPSPGFARITPRLPLLVRRALAGGALVPAPSKASGSAYSARRQQFTTLLEAVSRWHEDGLPLIPTSGGGLPGFALHRTLEQLVAAGLSPAQALALATLESAKRAGLDHEVGSVEPGKLADLVLARGDPLSNIAELGRVEWVVLGGEILHASDLYAAVHVSE
ncbi:MAG: amidohydrolase family protein [Myxococcales bacterium FL481]|nr:MAG: amidohydrolase family protein [Myxococcales bacterium FL481]